MYRIAILLLVGICVLPRANADIAIISHPSLSLDTLSITAAKRLFLKRKTTLEDGGSVEVKMLKHQLPIGQSFSRNVLQMSGSRLAAYWSRNIFTGEGQPPEQLETEEAMLEWVAATDNAIGFVDIMRVDDRVKVLLTVAD